MHAGLLDRIVRCDQRPEPGIRGVHTVETNQVLSGMRHQRCQLSQEVQRLEEDPLRPVPPLSLQPKEDAAVLALIQALRRDRRAQDVAKETLEPLSIPRSARLGRV